MAGKKIKKAINDVKQAVSNAKAKKDDGKKYTKRQVSSPSIRKDLTTDAARAEKAASKRPAASGKKATTSGTVKKLPYTGGEVKASKLPSNGGEVKPTLVSKKAVKRAPAGATADSTMMRAKHPNKDNGLSTAAARAEKLAGKKKKYY